MQKKEKSKQLEKIEEIVEEHNEEENITGQNGELSKKESEEIAKKNREIKNKFPQISKENYKEYVFDKSPKSSHFKNMFWAFLIGGLICTLGQGFIELYKLCGMEVEEASVLASSTLVALAAIFTGIGIYDMLGRFAGAGSTVPITGFSNAVVAPALEFRCEGMVYGLGAKMFLVAGPVIVNGVAISVVIALLTLIFTGGNL